MRKTTHHGLAWASLVGIIGLGALLASYQRSSSAQPVGQPHISQLSAVQDIFNASCVRCHGTGSPASSLDLTAPHSYGELIGQPSIQAPALMLVAPGSPHDSYLWLKVAEGQQHLERGGRGRRMPLGSPPLDPDQIRLIADWIGAGAHR